MALIVASIDYEHREIILRDKPAPMLTASPKGTVPVFISQNGAVIDESLDIMLWALAQNDPENWLGGDIEAMKTLIAQTQDEFKPHLDRYKYASRYSNDAKRGQLDLDRRAKAETFITKLETRLCKSRYLFGPAPQLADYAIFPFIRQFANTDRRWWDSADYSKLRAWLEKLMVNPAFVACMHKYALWQNPG